MTEQLVLQPIDALRSRHFHVPYYQRGYRWRAEQVRQLIEDIRAFQPTAEHGFYFLQALAVTQEDQNGVCHVIDGQQRLTTINLLLAHLAGKENILNITYDREADKALDRHFKDEALNVIQQEFPDSTSPGSQGPSSRRSPCPMTHPRKNFCLVCRRNSPPPNGRH